MSMSLIIIASSHGPSFVLWGTPAGTAPHSEEQSELSFTLGFQSARKPVIHDKTASGMSYTRDLRRTNKTTKVSLLLKQCSLIFLAK